MTENLPSLTIGDKTYAIDTLSDTARAQVNNLSIVDGEIARLNNQLAIAQLARASVIAALQAEVAKAG